MFNKSLTVHQKQQGFTLLEIMLVFLLMAMVSVGVIMTLPNQSASQKDIQWQAQRFRTLVQFAEDEALISGLQLGLVFDENSYQFAYYDYQTKKWLAVEGKQLQGKTEMPDAYAIEYSLSGLSWDELDMEEKDSFIDEDELVNIEGQEKIESLHPQVYLMSNGEVTPFTVDFSAVGNSTKIQPVTVSVSMNGTVSLTGGL